MEVADVVADERIAVVGLGYVGLPLALDLVDAGHRVHAIDADGAKVEELGAGRSHIDDIPNARLSAALAGGRLSVTDTQHGWDEESVAFICVPTPITATAQPDLGAVLAAGTFVRSGLRKGDMVVLQSTTYPGTTLGPLRNVLEQSGLRAGVDFGLAFAPERISPGEGRPASSIPRLAGGIDRVSTERLVTILAAISPQVTSMSSPDAAEMAKLFENVFRNVNIALVNELALICERLGLDVWEVIAGAATKPFGFMPFYPGPGVGGHCIPVDPYYLAARAREVGFTERFVETAGDINAQMPGHVVDLVVEALNRGNLPLRGSRLLVVGVAFKPDVADDRNSPAAPIIGGLLAGGATVSYHDPHLAKFTPVAPGMGTGAELPVLTSVELVAALDQEPDCVVILTQHTAIDWDTVFANASVIVDTRNVSAGRALRPGQVLRLGAGWS